MPAIISAIEFSRFPKTMFLALLLSFEKLTSLFEKEKTYIVVTHQEKVLLKADYILQLKSGRIENYGKAKQVLNKMGRVSCSKIGGGNETR